jgi:hypothetical protein
MSTRKYASGYEKLPKKKKLEKLIESKKGSLNKFVISNKQNINDNLVENHINEQEIHEKELEDNEIIQQKYDIENNDSDVQLCNITTLDEEIHENLEENKNIDDVSNSIVTSIYDPGKWKNIDAKLRDLLVENGPIRDNNINFPKDENSRHFSSTFYKRKLLNGEKHDRKWLVYSKDLDRIFCFCCKLFNSKSSKSTSR